MENSKKMTWYTLAFMAFSTVWGFGNVLNGFVYFNGIQVIFSWVMMFAAPVINPNAEYVTMEFTKEALIPKFNVGYFTSLSILVFAVGGCEKISPYVNKVKDCLLYTSPSPRDTR